ncbi:hypothetical protein N5C93_31035 [Pseudomonas nitroreducens]|uniref:hypothetical protein n=1 Tax=Pseudomonas nitroreducens TaxID=46680 RepID=UPI002446A0B2|nr:hypothetical protein [Pseudomonas nitroreducens]MDH1077274.1 hypothetical protein [Pseudomonas nitroreducens]
MYSRFIVTLACSAFFSCYAFSADKNIPDLGDNPYSKAREMLMTAGWKPVPIVSGHANDPYAKDLAAKGYKEVEQCGGSGLIPCSFLFVDSNHQLLRAVTLGEGDAPVRVLQKISGPDDGGVGARQFAYDNYRNALKAEQDKKTLSYKLIGVNYPAIEETAAWTVSIYDQGMEEAFNRYSKEYVESRSSIAITTPPPSKIFVADAYCSKQIASSKELWEGIEYVNDTVRKVGVRPDSGQEFFARMMKLRAEHIAKGESMPEMSDNDVSLTRMMLIAAIDYRLSQTQFESLVSKACDISRRKFAGPGPYPSGRPVAKPEGKKYLTRVLTKSNYSDTKYLESVRIDFNDEDLTAINDSLINSYIASGNFNQAINELKAQVGWLSINGPYTTVYGNQLNKLAAAYMMKEGDASPDARSALEESLMRMSKEYSNVFGQPYQNVNWVIKDTLELLKASYEASGDSSGVMKINEVLVLMKGKVI